MEAEYLLDSTVVHVRNKGCDDVKPRSLARFQKALNAVRSSIQMIRHEQGAKHPTLFAGRQGTKSSTAFPQKRKAWGTNVPHRWVRDCVEENNGKEEDYDVVTEELGRGLEADCWFCDAPFVKEEYDEDCGLWRCPNCGKCGCDLDDFTKQAIEKTYRALAGK